jgi:GAF domain-containing protein
MGMIQLDKQFNDSYAVPADGGRGHASQRHVNALASFLLRAQTPDEVAAVLFAYELQLCRADARILWSLDWPQTLHSEGVEQVDAELAARVAASVNEARRGLSIDPCMSVLFTDGGSTVAILYDPTGAALASTSNAVLDAVSVRMAECLAIQRLHETARRANQAAQLQRALFAIADMSGSELAMPEMLHGLHGIISELMYADNFQIVLYDPDRDSLRFIYCVDSVDAEVPEVDRDYPMAEFAHLLTGHLIRGGRPLMGTTEQLRQQVHGPLRIAGEVSRDWLGVPMIREGQVYGALILQTYVEGVRYCAADKELLGFVGEHVLAALEHKQSQAELERRVRERTRQLAEANASLREMIDSLERAKPVQVVL